MKNTSPRLPLLAAVLLCVSALFPWSAWASGDRDSDRLPDAHDACPDMPEDFDKFEDTDGCPEPDNDSDGILDVTDKCPNDPEDIDAFQDADGCPDPDNDSDGIPDVSDLCPNDSETFNGNQDDDGCPETVILRPHHDPAPVERLYFDAKAHKIAPQHRDILREVAAVLKAHPEVKKVRIEGHSDPCGHETSTSAFNVSQRRADMVLKALVDLGVDPARLEAVGYGSDRPIIDVSSLSGQDRLDACAKQRRVEFTILPDAP